MSLEYLGDKFSSLKDYTFTGKGAAVIIFCILSIIAIALVANWKVTGKWAWEKTAVVSSSSNETPNKSQQAVRQLDFKQMNHKDTSPLNVKAYKIMAFVDKEKESVYALNKLRDYINVIQVIDVTTPEGAKMSEEFKVPKDYPIFMSLETGYGSKGKAHDIDKLLEVITPILQESQSPEIVERATGPTEPAKNPSDYALPLKSLDIVFYSKDTCGHCVNAKKYLDEHGLTSSFTIKDGSLYTELPSHISESQKIGFPLFYSRKSGKHTMGFPGPEGLLSVLA